MALVSGTSMSTPLISGALALGGSELAAHGWHHAFDMVEYFVETCQSFTGFDDCEDVDGFLDAGLIDVYGFLEDMAYSILPEISKTVLARYAKLVAFSERTGGNTISILSLIHI